jgi:hypothetical protein
MTWKAADVYFFLQPRAHCDRIDLQAASNSAPFSLDTRGSSMQVTVKRGVIARLSARGTSARKEHGHLIAAVMGCTLRSISAPGLSVRACMGS